MKQFFSKSDAVTAVQVSADSEQIQIHGVWQSASRGTWIVRKCTTGDVSLVSDDQFKQQYVGIDL